MKKYVNITKIMIIMTAFMGLFTLACQKSVPNQQVNSNSNNVTRVIVEPVVRQPLIRTVKLSGKAEGIVDIDVMAEISGRLVSLNKELGDYVNKDEEIGRIDASQYEYALAQAEAQLLGSEVALRSAQMQLKADSLLFEQDSISEQGLLNSLNNYQQALSGHKGANAQYQQAKRTLDRAILKAPVSGYVAYLPISVGENIQVSSLVYTIVDDSEIVVRTGIGQNYINLVEEGDQVKITCNSANLQVKGSVTNIGRAAKIGESLYPIEIRFQNPGQMKSGMIINLELEKETPESMYSIRFTVVEQRYDQRFVYLAEGDKAVMKEVKLGEMVGNYVIVTQGLKDNDLLIVDSAGKLTDGQTISYTNKNQE